MQGGKGKEGKVIKYIKPNKTWVFEGSTSDLGKHTPIPILQSPAANLWLGLDEVR